jgi:Class-II DAHP synthetase family
VHVRGPRAAELTVGCREAGAGAAAQPREARAARAVPRRDTATRSAQAAPARRPRCVRPAAPSGRFHIAVSAHAAESDVAVNDPRGSHLAVDVLRPLMSIRQGIEVEEPPFPYGAALRNGLPYRGSLASGGYADLRQVHAWNQDFVADSPAGQRYEQLADEIDRAITFMQACGADPREFRAVEFYASHEALLLDYEQALTRTDARHGGTYDLSAHLLWIGERTRDPRGAHVEFARQIRNPIAVKIGPDATAQDMLELIEALDPDQEPGRLTLTTRMGARRIRQALPPLVEKVAASRAPVAWVCDPMHGNTVEAASGHKTRNFDDLLDEVAGFFEVHRALGTHPGGIHIEFTGDDVTECTGGGHHRRERPELSLRDDMRSPPQPQPVPGPGLPRRRPVPPPPRSRRRRMSRHCPPHRPRQTGQARSRTEGDAERTVRAALDLVAAVAELGSEAGVPGRRCGRGWSPARLL